MRHLFAVTALLLVTACTTTHTESDSKSNWLRDCTTKADCPANAACVCGVCTKACENADGCGGLSDATTICVNPSTQGLSVCQSDPLTGPNICLLACQNKDECDQAQSCVQGVCISTALVDAGVPTSTGNARDASNPPPVVNLPPDAGPTHTGPIDAGKPNTHPTTFPPNTNDPDEDGGVPDCGCTDAIACGIFRTCATAGVKVLTTEYSGNADIYGADADYVYGVIHTAQQGKLMRWPTAGGDGQEMAQGKDFYFGEPRFADQPMPTPSTQPPLLVDGDRLYFVAAQDTSELSNSLWSMPKDDSAMPVKHGYAGTVITQDADFVYFSNDGDSRVLRTAKTALDQREEIYRSAQDAPRTILLLASNSTDVFVTEVPPNAQDLASYTVTAVDKNGGAKAVLGTNERFGTNPRSTFASDTYFVLGGGQSAARLDLATDEIKLLSQGPGWNYMSFINDAVYGAGNGAGFWVVNLKTARRTSLTSEQESLDVTSNVAVKGGVYALISQFANSSQKLVHIKVTP